MKQATIAKEIANHVEHLTASWVEAVREDERILSDEGMSILERIDHVPAILEELSGMIEAGESPHIKNTHEARASVYTRLHQGYRGRDFIRELSLLRVLLLDYLTSLSAKESLDLSIEQYAKAARVINLYLDEEMRYAISVWGDDR